MKSPLPNQLQEQDQLIRELEALLLERDLEIEHLRERLEEYEPSPIPKKYA